MRIKVNTTDFSNEKVQEIISFVKQPKLGRVRIILQNMRAGGTLAGHTDGYTYVYVRITPLEKKFPCYHDIRGPEEIRSVGKPHPVTGEMVFTEYKYRKNAGYLPCMLITREEGLVYILAHELRHVWQKRGINRGRVWGSRRGRYSERDADGYAIKKMREWRKLHPHYLKELTLPDIPAESAAPLPDNHQS